MTTRTLIEHRLVDQMAKDRAKPSRLSPGPDGTTIVQVSGTTVGLAYALGEITGESFDQIMDRVG